MSFLVELLHVLRRRTARTGLEEAAAGEQRHDREHLRARAELEDREEIGQIVTQHVARDRDRVLTGAHALECRAHRLDRRENTNIEPARVVILEIPLDLLDQRCVMAAVLIEPENSGCARETRPLDAESDPVLNRQVFRLAHAPDVALLHGML